MRLAAAQVQHQFAQRALAAMGIALRVAVHRGPHRRARLLQVQVLHRADRETAVALVRVAEMVDRGEVGLEPARLGQGVLRYHGDAAPLLGQEV